MLVNRSAFAPMPTSSPPVEANAVGGETGRSFQGRAPQRAGLSDLPDEILVKVFGMLDVDSLRQAASVNYRFAQIASDDTVRLAVFLAPPVRGLPRLPADLAHAVRKIVLTPVERRYIHELYDAKMLTYSDPRPSEADWPLLLSDAGIQICAYCKDNATLKWLCAGGIPHATEKDYRRIFRMLAAAGKAVDADNWEFPSRNFVKVAIRACNIKAVIAMTKLGANLDAPLSKSSTLNYEAPRLQVILRCMPDAAIQAFRRAGIPFAAGSPCKNALAYAALDGRLPVMEALLRAGASPWSVGGVADERSPLAAAILANREGAVRLLCFHGANPSVEHCAMLPGDSVFYKPADAWELPLTLAARQHNAQIVRVLLEAGADPNALDSAGKRPGHALAEWFGVSRVSRLVATDLLHDYLAHGFDPDACVDGSRTFTEHIMRYGWWILGRYNHIPRILYHGRRRYLEQHPPLVVPADSVKASGAAP